MDNMMHHLAAQGPCGDPAWTNKIVLIDDQKIDNMINKRLITFIDKNIEIHDFTEPEKALQYLFCTSPDLILLDINMPDINGWHFLKLMNDHSLSIPVIMLSSSIDVFDRRKALAYDLVMDYIVKPLSFDDIRKLITKYL